MKPRQRNLKLILAIAADERTQYDIAFQAGMYPEQLSKYKLGFARPNRQQQEAIATALGMEVPDLFQDESVAS